MILLIDDGVLLSLDFSKSIKDKNNSAIFYKDGISDRKIFVLTINFFLLFLSFLDWPNLDDVTSNIYNFFTEFLNSTDNQVINNNININNRYDNRLNLSSSSLSILSNNSNDLSNENNSNNNSLMNLNENLGRNDNIRLRRGQRSVLEDMLGVFPY